MAKLIVLILSLSFYTPVFGLALVTDLDDTVKITNVENKPRAAWNALFSTKAFVAMPQLIRKIENYTSGTYIVSASPNLLDQRIRKFLEVNDLNPIQVYTRKLSQLGQKEKYKYESLKEIIEQSGEELILVGDNIELDARVYQRIQTDFPDKVKTIYIHKVSESKSIPAGITTFFTAFDIAIAEMKAKRMSLLGAIDVARVILLKRDLKELFPSFKYCPTSKSEFETDIPFGLKLVADQVFNKIIKYCENR